MKRMLIVTSFFDLPAEIRNLIYQYHVVENQVLKLMYMNFMNRLEPALLRAHSQIRREVRSRGA